MSDEISITEIPIGKLHPHPKNPKQHPQEQLDRIKRSLVEFGWGKVSVTAIKQPEKDSYTIITGHGIVEAARQLGYKLIPTRLLELSPEKAAAYVIADNKLAEIAPWDKEVLMSLIEDIEVSDIDVELTGFTMEEISDIAEELNPQEIVEAPVPDVPKKPKSKVGDIYQLGKHRLMCGDSTDKKDLDRLLIGNNVDLLLTDPPYGIDIVQNDRVGTNRQGQGKVPATKYKTIEGDQKPFNPQFMLKYADKIILFGANHYASQLPDNSHWLVWDKKDSRAADDNFFSDAELLWTNIKDRKNTVIYRHLWAGMLREGKRSVELKKRVHPTQKPVGLLAAIINDYTKKDELVLDLYHGSGSTLIACEQLSRTCYAMEIEPQYMDVTIKRWEDFTGLKAEKLKGGI